MAHFAKIGVDNIVLKVVCFDDTPTANHPMCDGTPSLKPPLCDGTLPLKHQKRREIRAGGACTTNSVAGWCK